MQERIAGVATLGNMYIIPIDAEKPVDANLGFYCIHKGRVQ
jgi:hypothetical protein